jgi:hypothetical protein
MSTSKIDKDNIIIALFDELPEEACLPIEADLEQRRQQLLSRYVKTRQGVFKKEDSPSPADQSPKVTTNVSAQPSPSHQEVVVMIDQSVGATMANSVQKLVEDTLVDKLRPLVLQIHEEQNLKKPATSNVSAPILPTVVNTLPSVSYAHNPHDGRNIMGNVAPNYVTSHAIKTDLT